MYLKRRIAAQRLNRVLTRTQCAAVECSPRIVDVAVTDQPSSATRALRGTWTDGALGRRRHQRLRLTSQVTLRRTGAIGFQVAIGDLSVGGCRVEFVEAVDVNERVIARLPGLEPFGAKVTWVDAHWAGLDFERPMHPAVLDQLLRRLC